VSGHDGSTSGEIADWTVTLVEPSIDDPLRLAAGDIDGLVLLHPGMAAAWDHAPVVVIVEEAGGRFTDPMGGSRIDLGPGVYSNGHTHDRLVSLAGFG
jgi:fructose-1,6-bisphosphatase/inositol monophosphatase family enzyme